jgi:hypothetical protein
MKVSFRQRIPVWKIAAVTAVTAAALIVIDRYDRLESLGNFDLAI